MYSKKQAEVMLGADARWNILSGAVRSGKTFVSYDLILKRLSELPDGDRLMIGRTQQTLERNVLNPLRRRLGGERMVSAVNSKSVVHIAGKPFYVLGANNKEAVTKIQGLGLIYAYGDEMTTWHEDVFVMLQSRLSDRGACFDGTCNPSHPNHWLKTGLLDREGLNIKQWHFVLEDNPFLPAEYVRDLKKEYTGVFYDRYIRGLWVRAEGIIYRIFAEDPLSFFVSDVPRLSEINIGMDFGGTKSLHSIVATGLTSGNKSLIALKSRRYISEGTTAADVERYACEFIGEILERYGRCDYFYWDNESSVLGNGLYGVIGRRFPQVTVRPCRKFTINNRISFTLKLMGTGRFGYTKECETLKAALEQAVWDDSKADTRLDDQSVDIDTLDAFEYSFCGNMMRFD